MKEWMKWLVLGVLSLIFGMVVLGNAAVASLAVTSLTGVLLLLSGGFQIAGGFSAESTGSMVLSIAMGALLALLGLSFLFNPLEGMISLALLVLILLAAGGVLRLLFAWRMQDTRFFWPMLVSGVLSILLAAYIWVNFAVAGPQLLGLMLGVELLFNGAGLIILAFFMRTIGNQLTK